MADSESASTSTSAVAPRLLRQLGYSLALCNNDGTILERDDDWSEIVGRTDDELLTIEADLIAHHPGAGGEAFRRDLIPLRRGDGVRVIEFVNVPLDDKPGHLLIAVREAPGQAADDLMANYLAALVETVDDAVVGTLPDGTIILWNDAATAIYGYGPADAIGQSISMVVRPEDQQALEEALRGVARGERINRISVQNVTRSGDLVNLQVSASPTRDGDGKITGSVFTGRDVSATREADRLARIYIGAIEHSPNGLVVFQSSANEDHFTLLAANHVGRRCLRLAAESIGKTIRELAVEFPPLAALPSTFDAFPIDEGRLDLGHHEVIDIDGRERTLETWAFGLPDRVIAFGFSDVTDHTGAERERDALLARVADAEDAERKRLAEALHDDTIQVLAAANMELGSLRRRAVDAGVTRSAERV